MISLIISTPKKKDALSELVANIKLTIGIDHEIIIIENPGKFSICTAYNLGEKQARHPYLCFLHDDVYFRKGNWGKLLVERFTGLENIGLIGLAGTKFKSSYPSPWGQSPFLHPFRRGHIYHEDKEGLTYLNYDNSPQPNDVDEVVCVDGVLLFTSKEVLVECRFDERMLTHFHGYDIDFSLQVHHFGYRILVTREIDIVHKSGGNYSKENTRANRLIAKKWKRILPATSTDLTLSLFQKNKLDVLNWIYFLWKAFIRTIRLSN